jgi:hypothetical protein
MERTYICDTGLASSHRNDFGAQGRDRKAGHAPQKMRRQNEDNALPPSNRRSSNSPISKRASSHVRSPTAHRSSADPTRPTRPFLVSGSRGKR